MGWKSYGHNDEYCVVTSTEEGSRRVEFWCSQYIERVLLNRRYPYEISLKDYSLCVPRDCLFHVLLIKSARLFCLLFDDWALHSGVLHIDQRQEGCTSRARIHHSELYPQPSIFPPSRSRHDNTRSLLQHHTTSHEITDTRRTGKLQRPIPFSLDLWAELKTNDVNRRLTTTLNAACSKADCFPYILS